MKIVQPECPHCSTLQKSEEDVNMSKKFCSGCSSERKSLAKRAFRNRTVVSVAGGNYIISKVSDRKKR